MSVTNNIIFPMIKKGMKHVKLSYCGAKNAYLYGLKRELQNEAINQGLSLFNKESVLVL